jgi:hypothetical protein
MAFWPGVAIGLTRATETFGHLKIFPDAVKLGTGPFALDLGVNFWGVGLCTVGFVVGALVAPRSAVVLAQAGNA